MIFSTLTQELTPAKAAGFPNALFLDVREPHEWDTVHLPGAVLIPLAELPSKADSLPKERPIIVVCHHGIRSQRGAQFLRKRGFKEVYNLIGGINRWAVDLDPTMVRY
jgi:rhodanese-related sulfurtransferase